MITRRKILKSSAYFAAPFILPAQLRSEETEPSEKITIGIIGMGKRSQPLLPEFLKRENVQVVAVCDVDTDRREDGKNRVDAFYENKDCAAYNDFREITGDPKIDAVVIITPDHWHVIQILEALNNGKDVYAEKPLTHNIRESKLLMDAYLASDRIVQTGSQQRSMREFRVGAELARNGILGKIKSGVVSFGGLAKACDLPGQEPPKGLDWDLWQGPAPLRPYNEILSPRGVHRHFPKWRMYTEYGGGMITDWGAHHIDIVQWALGKDDSGPDAAIPPAGKDAESGASLLYGDISITHGKSMGVTITGEEGEVNLARGGFSLTLGDKEFKPEKGGLKKILDLVEAEYLEDPETVLNRSTDHVGSFLDSIKSREQPNANAIVGSRSINACHLMNLAYFHDVDIKWDPVKATYAEGEKHPEEWLTRSYRKEWTI